MKNSQPKNSKNKVVFTGLLIAVLSCAGINGFAQSLFSDNFNLNDFQEFGSFNWKGDLNKDTIFIAKTDTVIAVHDFHAGDFYLKFRTIGSFVYLELVTTNSATQDYRLPWIIRQRSGTYEFLPLVSKRTAGKLTGRSYSEKDNFDQLTYHFISQYGIAKELFVIIQNPEAVVSEIKTVSQK